MDFNIEVRKKQLQSLDQYITSSKDKVQSILDYLGWNSKKLIEKEPGIMCSVNPHHILATKNADVHVKKCFIKSSGYQCDDEFLSEPINGPSVSIKLDHAKKIEILSKTRESNQKFRAAWNGHDSDPMTSDRLFATFSSDERLAMYDYCVKNTEHPPVPKEFDMQIEDKKEEKLLTQEELLAKQRDAKRRRIKYKSVHTGRSKSHTEIIREVISNQMEQFNDYLTSKMETSSYQTNIDEVNEQNLYHVSTDIDIKTENTNDTERPSSSISRYSNHSGNSRINKDCNKYEKSNKNLNHDTNSRRDYRHEKRREFSGKYDSPHKEKRRRKDFEDDYKYSRDKREWYKSDRRH